MQCPQSIRDCYILTALNLDLNLSKLFSSLISLAKSLKIKAPKEMKFSRNSSKEEIEKYDGPLHYISIMKVYDQKRKAQQSELSLIRRNVLREQIE